MKLCVSIAYGTANVNAQPHHSLMHAKCRRGYVIENEEEFVTSTTQYVNTTTDRKADAVVAALRVAPVAQESHQTTGN